MSVVQKKIGCEKTCQNYVHQKYPNYFSIVSNPS